MFKNGQSIEVNESIYPLSVLKRAIYKNLGNANFFISFKAPGIFKVFFKKKKKTFNLSLFFDDLNFYNLLEEENQRALPILDSILEEIKHREKK